MSTQRDYYEILGIPKGSSADEVKKAYRGLVLKYHPDRVPAEQKKEAEARFKEISEAYAVLSDEQKRTLYDQYGHAGIDSRFSQEDIFRNANFSDIFGSMQGGEAFADIFGGIFGGRGFDAFGQGGRRSSRGQKGEDVHLEYAISLNEAATGGEKEISFTAADSCSACRGSGAQGGESRQTCPACRGQGMVASQMGFLNFAQSCPQCQGEGTIIKNRCSKCGGTGKVRSKKTIKVTIPAGVETGSILRLRQEGGYGKGAKGDMYLHIAVKDHPVFKREDSNLRCTITVSVVKAVLGGKVDVPTLDGHVSMTIPAGTQPGSVFRLKNKGIMDLHTKRPGDELVEVTVRIPDRISGRERQLYQELAHASNESL